MAVAEAIVLGLAVALCVAIWANQGTLPPRLNLLLTILALLAVAAVVLRRVLG